MDDLIWWRAVAAAEAADDVLETRYVRGVLCWWSVSACCAYRTSVWTLCAWTGFDRRCRFLCVSFPSRSPQNLFFFC